MCVLCIYKQILSALAGIRLRYLIFEINVFCICLCIILTFPQWKSNSFLKSSSISYFTQETIPYTSRYDKKTSTYHHNFLFDRKVRSRWLKHASFNITTVIINSSCLTISEPELRIVQTERWSSLDDVRVTNNLKLALIDVSDNILSSIGISLSLHESLRVLTLSGNEHFQFTKADEENLSSKSLETFECDRCGVQVLSVSSFSRLPHLKSISLMSNKLRTLPTNLIRSLVIEKLFLSHNRELSYSRNTILLESDTISTFNCNNCNITVIDAITLSKMPSLRHLYLDGNRISTVDNNAFANNDNINVHLENNQLQEFPLTALNAKGITALCLDGNPLKSSANNNQLKKRYIDAKLRRNCTPVSSDKYFEVILADWFMPTTTTTTTTTTSTGTATTIVTTTTVIPKKGISDAFIASYLTLIIIIQGVVITMLILYLVKTIYRHKDDVFDYSEGVLNDHDIYNVLK